LNGEKKLKGRHLRVDIKNSLCCLGVGVFKLANLVQQVHVDIPLSCEPFLEILHGMEEDEM
jgi:hypothetical protein